MVILGANNLENFTEKAKQAIILAQAEARRLGHNFVGTESILLGIIAEEKGVAANLLKSLGITLKDARIEVEKTIGRGSGSFVGEAPFTQRASNVVEISYHEASQLNQKYVDTQHLLLALIREGEGVSLRILQNLGISSAQILNQLLTQINSSVNYTKLINKTQEENKITKTNETLDFYHSNTLLKTAIVEDKIERLDTILTEARKLIDEIKEIKNSIQENELYSVKKINEIIEDLPDKSLSEKSGIKELLNRLKITIENDVELRTEDKTEVLEQILNLALASQNPAEAQVKKVARTAIKIIIGTVAQRPPNSTLVKECKRIVPEIVKFFKLI